MSQPGSRIAGLQSVPDWFSTRKRAILFLRWVVIIVTSYLILFSQSSLESQFGIGLLIVFFLASNIVAGALRDELFSTTWFQGLLISLDTILISVGMMLAGESSSDLFLLYFSVLFLAALGENLKMIVGGSMMIAIVYLFVVLRTEHNLADPALWLRFPFLFGIAIFYGYLVEIAKSERQRARLAAEKEKFRTDFLATLTHDLQSPLSAIVGFSDVLLRAPGDDPIDGYRRIFSMIHQGARECSELVSSFLALAQGETRAGTLQRQSVNVNQIINDVLAPYQSTATKKGIHLRRELTPDLPALAADPTQIRRAISNLVGNAIKFGAKGGQVTISTELDLSAIAISVADNGPGIPAEIQARLFEQYTTGAAHESGTGLGLFIVRLIAEAHGGSITCESKAGQGARFILRLPLPAETTLSDISD
jgi:signal transduction histidine kinase